MFSAEQIRRFIADGRIDRFYNDRTWRRISNEVRQEQHNECQYCRLEGKAGRADIVHHVKHLRDFPELAYSKYYYSADGTKQQQLMCCCYAHHRLLHITEPVLRREADISQAAPAPDNAQTAPKFTNEERW